MSNIFKVTICIVLLTFILNSYCAEEVKTDKSRTKYEFPREKNEEIIMDPDIYHSGGEGHYTYAVCVVSSRESHKNCTIYTHNGGEDHGCNLVIEGLNTRTNSLKHFGNDKVILHWRIDGFESSTTLRLNIFEMNTCEVVDLSFPVEKSAVNSIVISSDNTFDIITSGKLTCNSTQPCRLRYDHKEKQIVKTEPFNVKLNDMVVEYLGENLFVRGADLISKDYKLMLMTPDGSSKTIRTLKDHAQVLSSSRGELYILCYTNYYGDGKNFESYTTSVRCSKYDKDGYVWMNKAIDIEGYVTLDRVEGLDTYEILLVRDRACYPSCPKTIDINQIFAYDDPKFHSTDVGCSDGAKTLAFSARKSGEDLLVDYVCEKSGVGENKTETKIIFENVSF